MTNTLNQLTIDTRPQERGIGGARPAPQLFDSCWGAEASVAYND
ncbi:MAG: hypothetical protein ABSB01_27495 [Streptosporangiaceae bacterium]|jgi:hypothetical protein